jgi:hypothetical protein
MGTKRILNASASAARFTAALLLLAACYCLNRFGSSLPEKLLALWRGFSLAYADFASKLAAHLPVSLAELLFYTLILSALAAFAAALSAVFSFKETGRIGSFFSGLLLGGSILVFVYYLLFGLWFDFASPVMPEIKRVTPTVDLLYRAAEDMQLKANKSALAIPRKNDGSPTYGSFGEMADGVCEKYAGRLEGLSGKPAEIAPPKEVLWSVGLSKLGITGIFVPYTGECNINAAAPVVSIPFTMAHELSHRYGTALEDECNYIAIDLLLDGNKEEAYSASFMGYLYLANALYDADPALWRKLKDSEDPLLSADLAAHSAYWKRYEGKSREVASAINDAQLKFNGDKDGEASYGRVADLLIARYAANL